MRFANPPDTVFQAILRNGLDVALDEIDDLLDFHGNDDVLAKEDFAGIFPVMAKVFTPSLARASLRQLRDRLDRPEIYYLNDYHYLLLFDMLQSYAVLHNDMVASAGSGEEKRESSRVDPFFIEQIDFDRLLGLYFFDIDFLTPPEVMLNIPPDFKKSFNPEAFGISQGLLPHPEELELKVDRAGGPERDRIAASEYFGPSSKVYPDHGYYEKRRADGRRMKREGRRVK